MPKSEGKPKKLYEALTWWADTGRPPVRGCTVADYNALWDLGDRLQRFHRADTFIEHAAQVLKKLGFHVEDTEVGWSI